MATDDSINATLDSTLSDMGARIVQSVVSEDGVTISHFVDGGTFAPGRQRWVLCNIADSAATQAAAIQAKLIEG